MPIDPLSVSIPATAPNDPCPDVIFTANGYLRYAQTKSRLVGGGANAPFNPSATINVKSAEGAKANYQLIALDPERSTGDEGLIRMVAVSSETEFEKLLRRAEVKIVIPAAGVDVVEAVRIPQEDAKDDAEKPFIPIGDPQLGYGFRVLAAQDDLPVADRKASVLIVDIKTPSSTIRRWVFDDATLTRDVPATGGAHAGPVAPDPLCSLSIDLAEGAHC